jgi:dCTP deaminase
MLTGPEIARQRKFGRLSIDPFDPGQLNPNSYDVCLGDTLVTYLPGVLDVRAKNPTEERAIPAAGLVLFPGTLYLGSTVETVGSDHFVGLLEGKSSLGRLGLTSHVTAGFIDTGFLGQVTCELSVVQPLRVYPGMRIGQICFLRPEGAIRLYAGKYQSQKGPVASRSHRDYPEEAPCPTT